MSQQNEQLIVKLVYSPELKCHSKVQTWKEVGIQIEREISITLLNLMGGILCTFTNMVIGMKP